MISYTSNGNYTVHLTCRFEAVQGFSLGRTTEITRDELKFTKFVQRVRKKFTHVPHRPLENKPFVERVISPDD